MSIIESIRDFMNMCPLLTDRTININYLGAYPGCCTVDNAACEPVIRRYSDGGTLRQYLAVFAFRGAYDEDPEGNLEEAELLEKLTDWIEEQNARGVLPRPGGGLVPVKIEVTKSGYLHDSSRTGARFQLGLRFICAKARR